MADLLQLSDEDAGRIIARLERHQGTPTELFDDLHALGEAGRLEAIPVVERYLTDQDPELRAIALSVITFHWHLVDHWATCAGMSQGDADSDVRQTAAAGLGSLRAGTKDPETLRVLLRIFHNTREDDSVRMMSYASILRVLGHHLTDGLAFKPPEPADVRPERIAEAEELANGREPAP